MSQAGLTAQGLTVDYGGAPVLRNLSLSFPAGRLSAILGPNGCGKSTLLRVFGGLIRPQAGRLLLEGAEISAERGRALARRLAILPQHPVAPEGITVAELTRRGRTPWRGLLSPWTPRDQEICLAAMTAVGLADQADRPVAELSGGQRQRAWIALILAQDAPCLLLDEPTAWLDLPHQIEVLSLLRRRSREVGATVVCVLHDLNLAARFADHLALLGPEGLVAEGAPAEVVTEKNLLRAFGLAARILTDPESGAPLITPRASASF